MLKGTYVNQYRKTGTGALILRYALTGTKAELDKYKEVQEKAGFLRLHENGAPLFFVGAYDATGQNRLLGAMINIAYSHNPANGTERFILDTGAEEMQLYAQAKALIPQALATARANAIMYRAQPQAVAAPVQAAAPSVENILDNMEQGAGVEELEGKPIVEGVEP